MHTLSKEHWHLEETLTFLNHGSFGACPREILQKQIQIQQQLESSPVAFYLRSLTPALQEAKDILSTVIKCSSKDLVLPNASEGVSTVLHNIDWQVGDEIIISNHAYPACRHMLSVLRRKKGIVVKIVYNFAHLKVDKPHTMIKTLYKPMHQKSHRKPVFIHRTN